MFRCDKCGICCESLEGLDLYSDLDRGDGTCKYFKEDSRTCKIYDSRPIKCDVDRFYLEYLIGKMSIGEYYNKNYEQCNFLKRGRK